MATSQITLDQKSDAALLSEIGMADHFPEDADLAFREFHERHVAYVYGRLQKWISDSDARSRSLDAEALASETMEQAYRKAAAFKDRSQGDVQLAENQARAWLMRIAMNLSLGALRQPAIRLLNDVTELPDEDSLEDVDPPRVSRQLAARAGAALGALCDMDREIVETCLAYSAYGETADALPDDIRKELLAKHGLAEATFRKRKSRAFKKLLELLS